MVPEIPRTIAKSLAIGSPPDGVYAAQTIKETGGWAVAASDAEIVDGIRLLAEDVGVFTETAGGVTVAVALTLAQQGHLGSHDEVGLCITGNGLKTVEAVRSELPEAPVIHAKLREVSALVDAGAAAGARTGEAEFTQKPEE